MTTMTLERLRDWHRRVQQEWVEADLREKMRLVVEFPHGAAATFLDAHLSQPAQAADVVAWRWRDNVRPGLPWKTTTDAEVIRQMEASGGYEIEPLTRALSGGKAGPVDGWRATMRLGVEAWEKYLETGGGSPVAHAEFRKTVAEFLSQANALLPASPTPDKEQA